MILTERQAEAELRRRGPAARRQVIAIYAEYRELAGWQARLHEADADREVITLDVLWSRLMLRFWRFLERRHASHIAWVRSLEADEQGGEADEGAG